MNEVSNFYFTKIKKPTEKEGGVIQERGIQHRRKGRGIEAPGQAGTGQKLHGHFFRR